MLRRLTEKEVHTFKNMTDRISMLNFLKSLGCMDELFKQAGCRHLYLDRIQWAIRFSEHLEYESGKNRFAKNLWISDSLDELPTLKIERLSQIEAATFADSVIDEEDEYYWPRKLDLNQRSIANNDMADLCDELANQWFDGVFEDRNAFVQYTLENFIYYSETISETKKAAIVSNSKKIIKSTEKTEIKQTKKRNGEKIMNIFGEGFGTIEGMAISMMTGEMAIPGEDGKFFTFNSKSKEITDVTDMVIEMELPAYAMPVAPETIVAGDIVRHNGQFLFVSSVTKAGKITGTKPDTAEEATIVPIKNALFNQSFVAKVTTINMFSGTPGAEGEAGKGPFGEMNPMLLMLMLKDKNGDSSNSMDKLLPLMMMQQGGLAAGAADGQINPMMMMLLMEKMGK